MQLPNSEPYESMETHATTNTPNGAEIRLWAYKKPNKSEWVEVVDIRKDGETITVGYHPGETMVASQTYNAMIEPFTDDNGNEKF